MNGTSGMRQLLPVFCTECTVKSLSPRPYYERTSNISGESIVRFPLKSIYCLLLFAHVPLLSSLSMSTLMLIDTEKRLALVVPVFIHVIPSHPPFFTKKPEIRKKIIYLTHHWGPILAH
jgi:hypothetical protein